MILCDLWLGDRYCSEGPARIYLLGLRCAAHTPAKQAGRDDHESDPDLTLQGLRDRAGLVYSFRTTDTALNDARAIASGRRRASPDAYRAAQMDVEARKRR